MGLRSVLQIANVDSREPWRYRTCEWLKRKRGTPDQHLLEWYDELNATISNQRKLVNALAACTVPYWTVAITFSH